VGGLGSGAVILDLFHLEGKVAIVTGASRGIGAATARALAEAGCDLVLSARSADVLESFAEEVRQATGRKVEAVPADLNDLDNLTALADRAKESFGRLDVVVNNVGGSMPRPFMDTSAGYIERAFHWNVITAFALTKACVPLLHQSGGGSVINISSSIGHLSDRGFIGYGTAKAALDKLTEMMAADLAPKVRVNAVAPGSIETEALGGVLSDEMKATMISLTPMRRLGRPDDIAAAVLYLASDAASYMTGKVLQVDGGQRVANLPLGLPDL
jgi:7-alpha-hydroxysteroid dehydrogenase